MAERDEDEDDSSAVPPPIGDGVSLAEEIDHIKNLVNISQSQIFHELDQLKERINGSLGLRSEITDQKQVAQEVRSREVEVFEERIGALKKENDESLTALDDANLTDERDILLKSTRKTHDELEKCRAHTKQLSTSLHEASSRVDHATVERQAAATAVEDSRKQIIKLEGLYARASSSLTDAQRETEELRASQSQLSDSLDNAKARIKQLEVWDEESSFTIANLEQLGEETSQSLKAANDQVITLQEEYRKVTELLQHSKEDYASLQQATSDEISGLKRFNEEACAISGHAEEEIVKLQEQVRDTYLFAQQSKEESEAELRRAQDEISRLTELRDERSRELDEIKSLVERLEREKADAARLHQDSMQKLILEKRDVEASLHEKERETQEAREEMDKVLVRSTTELAAKDQTLREAEDHHSVALAEVTEQLRVKEDEIKTL
ncbi:hypothetical protein B0A49_05114, partial [Cryomyces minteri]